MNIANAAGGIAGSAKLTTADDLQRAWIHQQINGMGAMRPYVPQPETNTMNVEFKKVDNGYIIKITAPGKKDVVLVAAGLREAADLVVAHAVAEKLE